MWQNCKILWLNTRHAAWQEPPLGDFKGQPSCLADQQAGFAGDPHTLGGTLFRVTSCEILYGPLNCGFVPSGENWCVHRFCLSSPRLAHAHNL